MMHMHSGDTELKYFGQEHHMPVVIKSKHALNCRF